MRRRARLRRVACRRCAGREPVPRGRDQRGRAWARERRRRRLPGARELARACAPSWTSRPAPRAPTRSPTTTSPRRLSTSCPSTASAEAYLSADGIEAFVASAEGALVHVRAARRLGRVARRRVRPQRERRRVLARHPERRSTPSGPRRSPASSPRSRSSSPSCRTISRPTRSPTWGSASRGTTVAALLRQATVRAPGIAAGVTDLIESLRGGADVDLQRDLLEALGGEAAFAVVPRGAGGTRSGGAALREHADPVPRVPRRRRRRGACPRGARPAAGADRPVVRPGAGSPGLRAAPLRRPRGAGAAALAGRADHLRDHGLDSW